MDYSSDNQMEYFHYVSILKMGYLMTFTGVYGGTLYRNQYHGFERIDYTEYYDYDPEKKPCYSIMHKPLMVLGRSLVFLVMLTPFYVFEEYYA